MIAINIVLFTIVFAFAASQIADSISQVAQAIKEYQQTIAIEINRNNNDQSE